METKVLVHFSLRDVKMECKSVNMLRFVNVFFNFVQVLSSNLTRVWPALSLFYATLLVNIPIYIQPTFVSPNLMWKYKNVILHKMQMSLLFVQIKSMNRTILCVNHRFDGFNK